MVCAQSAHTLQNGPFVAAFQTGKAAFSAFYHVRNSLAFWGELCYNIDVVNGTFLFLYTFVSLLSAPRCFTFSSGDSIFLQLPQQLPLFF